MKTKQSKKQKGLTDAELIAKYETGKPINLGKLLKPMLKKQKPSN